MKNSLLLAVMVCLLISTGCSRPSESCQEVEPENSVNEEGPWYSEDTYLCGNYYKHQKAKHTVPIVCGSKDGECGIINCDCICHK